MYRFRYLPLFLFLLISTLLAAQELQVGDAFPPFDLKDGGMTSQDLAYLGLSSGSLFKKAKMSLNDIGGSLLLVEFFNKYCIVCQQDAPEFNRFFQEVEKDAELRGKVRMLGIGIGNSSKEVGGFRQDFAISFPLYADRETMVYRKIGSPRGSPLVYILRKKEGKWIIVDGFKGEASYADMVMRAKVDLGMDLARVKRTPLWVEEPLKKVGEEEVRKVLRQRMPGARVSKILSFENGDLYAARKGKEALFVKAEARKIICTVCHDISFLYVFDRKGVVRDFIPLYLTKEDNAGFSQKDVERIKRNLVGRSMLMPFKFDKEVDAVTSATLTSLIIYDSVHHGKELLKAIEMGGY